MTSRMIAHVGNPPDFDGAGAGDRLGGTLEAGGGGAAGLAALGGVAALAALGVAELAARGAEALRLPRPASRPVAFNAP